MAATALRDGRACRGPSCSSATVYTYDPAGNRLSRVTTLGTSAPTTTSYQYNADNELCWQYNGTSTAACTAPPSGAAVYGYDAAGNQISGAAPLTWDARGRLASINGSTVTHLSPTNSELTAVGTGDNYQNTLLGAGRITTGGVLASLVRKADDQSVVSQTKSGAKVWLVTDNLGSTIATLNSAGTLQRASDYDTDGAANTSGTGQTTNIQYAGGHYVGANLIHYGARYYQTTTGRWTQPDPLDQPGDLAQQNRYLYVGNNPINYIDLSGRCIERLSPNGCGPLEVKPTTKSKSRKFYDGFGWSEADLFTSGACYVAAPVPGVAEVCLAYGGIRYATSN